MVALVAYTCIAILWVRYVSERSTALKNWQRLLCWTIFLPMTLACMLSVRLRGS